MKTTSVSETRPMGLGVSSLCFGAFALVGLVNFYGLRPALLRLGIPDMASYLLALDAGFLLMLVLAVLLTWHEGVPFRRRELQSRYRLRRPPPVAWIWAGGCGLFMLVVAQLYLPLLSWGVEQGAIVLPASLPPYLDPTAQQSLASMAATLESEGRWLVLLIPVTIALNVSSEEILWRGVLLPRQERHHGRMAWAYHGLQWSSIHVFQWWLLPGLLPGMLGLAYVAQRFENTWVGIVAHALNNGLPLIVLGLILLFQG